MSRAVTWCDQVPIDYNQNGSYNYYSMIKVNNKNEGIASLIQVEHLCAWFWLNTVD